MIVKSHDSVSSVHLKAPKNALPVLFACAITLSYFSFLQIHPDFRKTVPLLESRFITPPLLRDDPSPNSSYPLPLTRSQVRNRVFISALPNKTSDGLGHRLMLINFELNAAISLGVGYGHRTPKYGSLSPRGDPLAVERLFGWIGYPDLRDNLLSESCVSIQYTRAGSNCTSTLENFPRCTALKPDGPFKHLVYVPAKLVNCLQNRPWHNWQSCREGLQNFSREHNEPDTLFQMTTTMCAPEHRDDNYVPTGRWLREHYWQHHRWTTSLNPGHSWVSRTRVLPFEEERIQVAVHVRRGDFFNYTSRVLIPDGTYADVAVAVKEAVDEVFKTDVPTTVSIFSEGVPRRTDFRCFHDISRMEKIYLSEKGERIRDAKEHWERMIQERLRGRGGTDIKVQTFIATDTVSAVHAMLCADVFIGSISGMSVQLVQVLSRGLLFMPAQPGSGAVDSGVPYKVIYGFGDGETDINDQTVRAAIRRFGGDHFGRKYWLAR